MFLLPILLTRGYVPTVTFGQVVKKGDELAYFTGISEQVINVSHALGVPVRRVRSYLKKRVGDTVLKREVLAHKPGVLGLSGESLISQVEGIVTQIFPDSGDVVIQMSTQGKKHQLQSLISPIDGVISLCDNEKIVIQTDVPVLVATHGIGQSSQGELHVTSSNPAEEVNYYTIDANISGKILLTGIASRDLLVKALGMNVAGIITAMIAERDLAYIQQKYTFPVLIVSEKDYQHLSLQKGKHTFIDGMSKSIVV